MKRHVNLLDQGRNSMKTLSLTKEELCLISIALNEYQMDLDNYHLDEMRQVSTKIDTIYKDD